jgi:hypothetical protein
MIIEAIMLGALGYYHSWLALITVVALILFRRWPWLANQIAGMLELETYDGMTAWIARHALPAWSGARGVMSRSEGAPAAIGVPGTVGTASTNAPNLPDRDISADAWIVALASATDEKGRPKFSASKIFALLGGHRATVLARVKEIQEGIPPPQFRQDDGSTAPAEYPVTKSAATYTPV